MKKVLLTGTALLAFAAAGFAQTNTATTNQNGDKQTAVQTQTGNYLKSTITQDKGTGSNTGSYAGTFQASTGTAGNEALIEQKTNANSNRAFVTQSGGTGNKGTIEQTDNSGGGSLQVGSGTSAADVKAAGGNWAGILQQGSNNTNTYIIQGNTASKNFGEIYQYGSANRQTSIDQSAISNGNMAKVNQGTSSAPITNGRVQVSQQANSQNNEAYVTQLASSNDAVVTQNGGTSGASQNNKATIEQTGGSRSSATVEQRNNSFYNQATVTQQRSANTGTVQQSNNSGFNTADIMQKGFVGTASISQTGLSYDNIATINQNGSFNTATITENYAGNNRATINQSLVRPEGGSNIAEILQGDGPTYSSGNKATINQDFSQNTAKLKQMGIGNTADLSQMVGDLNVIKGLGDSPYALQQGNSNMLKVTQNSGDGTSPYVPNVANVSQIGNGNMATISQTGAN